MKTPLAPAEPHVTYCDVKGAASLLGVSRGTVYRRIREGDLPAFKFGSRVLIRWTDIENSLTPYVTTDKDHA